MKVCQKKYTEQIEQAIYICRKMFDDLLEFQILQKIMSISHLPLSFCCLLQSKVDELVLIFKIFALHLMPFSYFL